MCRRCWRIHRKGNWTDEEVEAEIKKNLADPEFDTPEKRAAVAAFRREAVEEERRNRSKYQKDTRDAKLKRAQSVEHARRTSVSPTVPHRPPLIKSASMPVKGSAGVWQRPGDGQARVSVFTSGNRRDPRTPVPNLQARESEDGRRRGATEIATPGTGVGLDVRESETRTNLITRTDTLPTCDARPERRLAPNTHCAMLTPRNVFEDNGDDNVSCRRSDMMNQGAAAEGSGRDARDQRIATAERGTTRNSGGNPTRPDGGSELFGRTANVKGTSVVDQHEGAPRDKEPPDK